MSDSDRLAFAWWIERSDEKTVVCFDTDGQGTVSFDVTEASFGGEIHE